MGYVFFFSFFSDGKRNEKKKQKEKEKRKFKFKMRAVDVLGIGAKWRYMLSYDSPA